MQTAMKRDIDSTAQSKSQQSKQCVIDMVAAVQIATVDRNWKVLSAPR